LSNKDWWSELSEDEIALIRKGSEQVDKGEVIPDASVRNKARKLLQKAN